MFPSSLWLLTPAASPITQPAAERFPAQSADADPISTPAAAPVGSRPPPSSYRDALHPPQCSTSSPCCSASHSTAESGAHTRLGQGTPCQEVSPASPQCSQSTCSALSYACPCSWQPRQPSESPADPSPASGSAQSCSCKCFSSGTHNATLLLGQPAGRVSRQQGQRRG